jgi:hypothetical protein
MDKINIAEIEQLFQLVIEKLKSDNIKEVEFSFDEYWIILSDDWNNFSKEPVSGVGSLSEDLKYLKEVIAVNKIYSYSEFDRLATILRAISERQAPSNSEK